MRYVRWIGAFGRGKTLHECLVWELNNSRAYRERADRRAAKWREVAVEPIRGRVRHIRHVRVGLLVRRRAVISVFDGDVWSVVDGRKLKKTRHPHASHSYHGEAWAMPDYCAIVVVGWAHLRPRVRRTVAWFSDMYGLPVVDIGDEWRTVKGGKK